MPSVFDVGSTSAGEMFLGAFVPGLLLVGIYMVYTFLASALLKPSAAPAVPYEGTYDRKFFGKVLLTLVPPLALIFLVLGSIISGIATVNQAGAIGAAGALIMAGYRLEGNHRSRLWPCPIIDFGCDCRGLCTVQLRYERQGSHNSPKISKVLWIGALGTALIVIGVVWSGYRALKIDRHAKRRDDGNRQNNGIGFRDPAWCGHANRRLPRLWR